MYTYIHTSITWYNTTAFFWQDTNNTVLHSQLNPTDQTVKYLLSNNWEPLQRQRRVYIYTILYHLKTFLDCLYPLCFTGTTQVLFKIVSTKLLVELSATDVCFLFAMTNGVKQKSSSHF